jgi:hypothetical protein
MTGIGVEDTLKAVTKLVLNNLSAKYRLEDGTGARAGAAPPEEATRPADGNRRRKPAPRELPPEDRALDALGGDGEAEEFSLPSAPPPAAAPARGAGRVHASAGDDDVIELVDEVEEETKPAPGGSGGRSPAMAPRPATPATVTMHPAAMRSASAPGAMPVHAPMTSQALAAERNPLDIEDPIDLGDALDEPVGSSSGDALQIGPIRPGEERELEVPVRIDLDGRKVLIQLRLKVRLSG